MTSRSIPIPRYHDERRKAMPHFPHLSMTSALAILAAFSSVGTLAWGGYETFFGQMPDPMAAGAWPFYGVLLVAIIVLFCTCLYGLRWFFQYWLKEQKDMIVTQSAERREQMTLNREMLEVMKKNTEVTAKQNEWMEQIIKDSVKQHLTAPYPRPHQ